MSFVLLGILNSAAAGGAEAYWLNLFGGSDRDRPFSLASDSNGNSYYYGLTRSTGTNEHSMLLSLDADGLVKFQRSFGGSGGDDANKVVVDSSNNIYISGETTSSGGQGSNEMFLAKYNDSGTLQWQRILGDSDNNDEARAAVDGSGNIYLTGSAPYRASSTGTQPVLAKYNSSGAIQWQRSFGDSQYRIFARGIAVNSSGDVYVVGETNEGTGEFEQKALIFKYNTSGTLQWQKTLGAHSTRFVSAAIASNGDVYAGGYTNVTGQGGIDYLIVKYNSFGSLLWQRTLGIGTIQGAFTNDDVLGGIAVDSEDNVYVQGRTNDAIDNDTAPDPTAYGFAKFDSSGNLVWQRVLGSISGDLGTDCAVDSNDNLYVTGYTSMAGQGNNEFFSAKLPNDGSLTGTYSLDGNDVAYVASSLVVATSTLTDSTISNTQATSSLTPATASLTSATSSLISVTTEI